MPYAASDWSTADSSSTARPLSNVLELAKVGLLTILLLACGVSWFFDPFAPSRTAGGGYLELPMDQGGFQIMQPCNVLRKEAAQCRKDQPKKDAPAAVPVPIEPRDSPKSFMEQAADMAAAREGRSPGDAEAENGPLGRGCQKTHAWVCADGNPGWHTTPTNHNDSRPGMD